MVKPRIAIILNSKFPTAKAYGITSKYTCEELIKIGCEVKIFSSPSEYTDRDFKLTSKYTTNFKSKLLNRFLIKLGERNSSRTSNFLWLLGTMHRLITNLNLISQFKPDIIWTRDPWCAFLTFLKFNNTKVILEIHSKSSKLFFRLLSVYNNRLYYFPINQKNEKFLLKIQPEAKYLIAPMGIDAKNLAKSSEIRKFIIRLRTSKYSKIKIGYVGKFSPQHYSKGFEDLILVSNKFQKNRQNFEVTLVGYLPDEKKELDELISNLGVSSKYLKLKKHVPHSKAIEIMKKFDILIMPLPNNTNYRGMPLKLLEYLSVGKITIIAKSDLTTNLFKGKYRPFFYEKNDPESLYECIFSSLNSKDLYNNITNGVNFASEFSWQLRTESILNFTLNKI